MTDIDHASKEVAQLVLSNKYEDVEEAMVSFLGDKDVSEIDKKMIEMRSTEMVRLESQGTGRTKYRLD